MPFAVTLRLDDAATSRVEALWMALADRGVSTSARRLAYPPHVTLAVCDEKAEQAALVDIVRRVGKDWPSLPVTCPALGAFADPPLALFLVVTASEALLQRQAALCQALPQERLHPHYRPGTWLPHVTLADDVQPARLAAAMGAALPEFQPFTADLVQLNLVRFRPVKILFQAPLGEGLTQG